MSSFIDLTNQRFGRLVALERDFSFPMRGTAWVCQCDCGTRKTIRSSTLRNGHSLSCGCLPKEINSKRRTIDHTGERYGRLVVLSRDENHVTAGGNKKVRWLCRCDCGNTITVSANDLTSGHTASCGCLYRDSRTECNKTDGRRSDRLYGVYSNMKSRCYNPKSTSYKYYGGRGIKIAQEWLDDYAAFRKWAYANGYDDAAPHGECTIDRIDVDGNYEPSNCRWVNLSTQSKNRRNTKAYKAEHR